MIDATRTRVTYGRIGALAPMLDALAAYDATTAEHLLHVDRLAYHWGLQMRRSRAFAKRLATAALAHDIGKLFVPAEILKKPAQLDARETGEMRRHVEIGSRLLAIEPKLSAVRGAVEQHHERFDGTGYPNGLRGEEIDPLARAVSVVDAYSAMTLDRPYHPSVSSEAALREIESCAGTQFDPDIVASFVRFMRNEQATGTPVRATGRRAPSRRTIAT